MAKSLRRTNTGSTRPEDQFTGAIANLPAHWRSRAEQLESWGALGAGRVTRALSVELERTLQTWLDQDLTPSEWASSGEVGLTADWIAKLVARGELPNRGRPNAPRVRRADLYRYCLKLPLDPAEGVANSNTSSDISLRAYGDDAVIRKTSTKR